MANLNVKQLQNHEKNLLLLLLTFISLSFFYSCSNEEKTEVANLQYTAPANVIALKKDYDNILKTQTYITYKSTMLSFIDNANRIQTLPIETRSGFSTWLNANRPLTKWLTKNDALRDYDALIVAKNALYQQNTAFYDAIDDLQPDDLQYILGGGFTTVNPVNNATSCQDSCMDTVIDELGQLESDLCEKREFPGINGLSWYLLDYWYWNDVEISINKFNDCMGAC